MKMNGEYLEKSAFPTSSFLLYTIVSAGFLTAYSCFYAYIFKHRSAGHGSRETTKCCDPMRFGLKTFLVLSFPILANTLHLADSTLNLFCYFKQEDNDTYFEIDAFAVMAVMVTSLAIVNYYQLKVAGIAAI